jgi:hypothetical protein
MSKRQLAWQRFVFKKRRLPSRERKQDEPYRIGEVA